jgi:hypothetical protein
MDGLVQALRLLVKRNLDRCDKVHTPKVKAILEKKGGYLMAEEMVIRKMIKDHLTIGASIAQLETELP